MAIAGANSCKIFTKGPNIHIIGTESDVNTVRYLFAYCENEIERLSKNYKGYGKGWINNYKLGAVSAVRDALLKAKEEARNELMIERGSEAGAAIAIIDSRKDAAELWARKNLNLQQKGFGRQSLHRDARQIGYQDGKTINLSSGRGIGPGNKRIKG